MLGTNTFKRATVNKNFKIDVYRGEFSLRSNRSSPRFAYMENLKRFFAAKTVCSILIN